MPIAIVWFWSRAWLNLALHYAILNSHLTRLQGKNIQKKKKK